MSFSPIVIIGVPRSGTTLLRVLLDSHPQILALPETPWMTQTYGGLIPFRQFLQSLIDGSFGVVRNVAGVGEGDVLRAGASFLERLFAPALEARGKSIVAFKTPADIQYLEFLTALLPDARYIHITRDGRDVALSQLVKKGSFFLDLRGYKSFSYANVMRRWMEWEQKARSILYRGNLQVFHLRYEDLIADPEREMKGVTAFLGLPFDPRMLDYASKSHDYPKWEAGSADVVQRQNISVSSVGKWRKSKNSIEMLHTLMRYDGFLMSLGYPSSDLNPGRLKRVLIAGYGALQPALEGLAQAARGVRPLIRNRNRALACFSLLLLAAQFLAAPFLHLNGAANVVLDMLLSFAATLSFTMAFMPVLQRQGGTGYGAVAWRAGLSLSVYVALLSAGRALISGAAPALGALLLSIIAIVAGLFVVSPLAQRHQQTA